MALSREESAAFTALSNQLSTTQQDDLRMDRYYDGKQRLEQIGLAVPPELRRFETLVNWPSLVVDSVEERIDVKAIMLPGEDSANPVLWEGWEANNLDSESHLLHLDILTFGRGYACVGTNEDDPDHPLITVDSPLELTVRVDQRRRRVRDALRLYGGTEDEPEPTLATLYLDGVTIWLQRESGRWVDYDRDEHGFPPPVVPFFNRRRTGRWQGVSEMTNSISLTDAAARSLTNLQIAGETHSVPQKWVLGMSKGDFVDSAGNPIPAWESYFSAIWANQNQEAKVGQFTASDLSNFHSTVNHYAQLLAGLYGLPMRYLGQNTANPPSADGIRADEARLVKRAERKMTAWGDPYGHLFGLYLRFRDPATDINPNRIKVEWHDAATPTYAAKVDGIQKLTGGQPILSREGGWDELGWSESRKARERERMEREASEEIRRVVRDLETGEGATSAPVGE